MAYTDYYNWVRRKTGDNSTTLPDEALAPLFTDVSTIDRPGAGEKVVAWAVVIDRLQYLKADAAKKVDYKSGESSESLSQLYKHLDDLLEDAEVGLAKAVSDDAGSIIRIAKTRRKPTRLKEYPDG